MLTLNGSRNKMKIILNIHRPGIHKHNLRSLNQNIVVPMKAANWSLQKKAVRGGGGAIVWNSLLVDLFRIMTNLIQLII